MDVAKIVHIMIKVVFTEESIKSLKQGKVHHPHHRVRQKMEALFLKSMNFSHAQIISIVGISLNTLTTYLKEFQEGGIEKLQELNFYQKQSQLEEHKVMLQAHFALHPFVSINQAKATIEELTKVSLSPTQIRDFLSKIGLKRRKVGSIPAKADVEKQATFLTEKLFPKLAEAQNGVRQIFLLMLLTLS